MARTDWNVRARAHACMKCAVPFEAGMCCHSGILPFDHELAQEIFVEKRAEENSAAPAQKKENPDYVRVDICENCRKALSGVSWVSTWKSVCTPPESANAQKNADPFHRENTESLLRRLLESEEAENFVAPIYLLAVMLERKRILIERATRHAPDGTVIHLYEHRKSGDILLVADPHLTVEQIPDVRQQIELLLSTPEILPDAAPAQPANPD